MSSEVISQQPQRASVFAGFSGNRHGSNFSSHLGISSGGPVVMGGKAVALGPPCRATTPPLDQLLLSTSGGLNNEGRRGSDTCGLQSFLETSGKEDAVYGASSSCSMMKDSSPSVSTTLAEKQNSCNVSWCMPVGKEDLRYVSDVGQETGMPDSYMGGVDLGNSAATLDSEGLHPNQNRSETSSSPVFPQMPLSPSNGFLNKFDSQLFLASGEPHWDNDSVRLVQSQHSGTSAVRKKDEQFQLNATPVCQRPRSSREISHGEDDAREHCGLRCHDDNHPRQHQCRTETAQRAEMDAPQSLECVPYDSSKSEASQRDSGDIHIHLRCEEDLRKTCSGSQALYGMDYDTTAATTISTNNAGKHFGQTSSMNLSWPLSRSLSNGSSSSPQSRFFVKENTCISRSGEAGEMSSASGTQHDMEDSSTVSHQHSTRSTCTGSGSSSSSPSFSLSSPKSACSPHLRPCSLSIKGASLMSYIGARDGKAVETQSDLLAVCCACREGEGHSVGGDCCCRGRRHTNSMSQECLSLKEGAKRVGSPLPCLTQPDVLASRAQESGSCNLLIKSGDKTTLLQQHYLDSQPPENSNHHRETAADASEADTSVLYPFNNNLASETGMPSKLDDGAVKKESLEATSQNVPQQCVVSATVPRVTHRCKEDNGRACVVTVAEASNSCISSAASENQQQSVSKSSEGLIPEVVLDKSSVVGFEEVSAKTKGLETNQGVSAVEANIRSPDMSNSHLSFNSTLWWNPSASIPISSKMDTSNSVIHTKCGKDSSASSSSSFPKAPSPFGKDSVSSQTCHLSPMLLSQNNYPGISLSYPLSLVQGTSSCCCAYSFPSGGSSLSPFNFEQRKLQRTDNGCNDVSQINEPTAVGNGGQDTQGSLFNACSSSVGPAASSRVSLLQCQGAVLNSPSSCIHPSLMLDARSAPLAPSSSQQQQQEHHHSSSSSGFETTLAYTPHESESGRFGIHPHQEENFSSSSMRQQRNGHQESGLDMSLSTQSNSHCGDVNLQDQSLAALCNSSAAVSGMLPYGYSLSEPPSHGASFSNSTTSLAMQQAQFLAAVAAASSPGAMGLSISPTQNYFLPGSVGFSDLLGPACSQSHGFNNMSSSSTLGFSSSAQAQQQLNIRGAGWSPRGVGLTRPNNTWSLTGPIESSTSATERKTERKGLAQGVYGASRDTDISLKGKPDSECLRRDSHKANCDATKESRSDCNPSGTLAECSGSPQEKGSRFLREGEDTITSRGQRMDTMQLDYCFTSDPGGIGKENNPQSSCSPPAVYGGATSIADVDPLCSQTGEVASKFLQPPPSPFASLLPFLGLASQQQQQIPPPLVSHLNPSPLAAAFGPELTRLANTSVLHPFAAVGSYPLNRCNSDALLRPGRKDSVLQQKALQSSGSATYQLHFSGSNARHLNSNTTEQPLRTSSACEMATPHSKKSTATILKVPKGQSSLSSSELLPLKSNSAPGVFCGEESSLFVHETSSATVFPKTRRPRGCMSSSPNSVLGTLLQRLFQIEKQEGKHKGSNAPSGSLDPKEGGGGGSSKSQPGSSAKTSQRKGDAIAYAVDQLSADGLLQLLKNVIAFEAAAPKSGPMASQSGTSEKCSVPDATSLAETSVEGAQFGAVSQFSKKQSRSISQPCSLAASCSYAVSPSEGSRSDIARIFASNLTPDEIAGELGRISGIDDREFLHSIAIWCQNQSPLRRSSDTQGGSASRSGSLSRLMGSSVGTSASDVKDGEVSFLHLNKGGYCSAASSGFKGADKGSANALGVCNAGAIKAYASCTQCEGTLGREQTASVDSLSNSGSLHQTLQLFGASCNRCHGNLVLEIENRKNAVCGASEQEKKNLENTTKSQGKDMLETGATATSLPWSSSLTSSSSSSSSSSENSMGLSYRIGSPGCPSSTLETHYKAPDHTLKKNDSLYDVVELLGLRLNTLQNAILAQSELQTLMLRALVGLQLRYDEKEASSSQATSHSFNVGVSVEQKHDNDEALCMCKKEAGALTRKRPRFDSMCAERPAQRNDASALPGRGVATEMVDASLASSPCPCGKRLCCGDKHVTSGIKDLNGFLEGSSNVCEAPSVEYGRESLRRTEVTPRFSTTKDNNEIMDQPSASLPRYDSQQAGGNVSSTSGLSTDASGCSSYRLADVEPCNEKAPLLISTAETDRECTASLTCVTVEETPTPATSTARNFSTVKSRSTESSNNNIGEGTASDCVLSPLMAYHKAQCLLQLKALAYAVPDWAVHCNSYRWHLERLEPLRDRTPTTGVTRGTSLLGSGLPKCYAKETQGVSCNTSNNIDKSLLNSELQDRTQEYLQLFLEDVHTPPEVPTLVGPQTKQEGQALMAPPVNHLGVPSLISQHVMSFVGPAYNLIHDDQQPQQSSPGGILTSVTWESTCSRANIPSYSFSCADNSTSAMIPSCSVSLRLKQAIELLPFWIARLDCLRQRDDATFYPLVALPSLFQASAFSQFIACLFPVLANANKKQARHLLRCFGAESLHISVARKFEAPKKRVALDGEDWAACNIEQSRYLEEHEDTPAKGAVTATQLKCTSFSLPTDPEESASMSDNELEKNQGGDQEASLKTTGDKCGVIRSPTQSDTKMRRVAAKESSHPSCHFAPSLSEISSQTSLSVRRLKWEYHSCLDISVYGATQDEQQLQKKQQVSEHEQGLAAELASTQLAQARPASNAQALLTGNACGRRMMVMVCTARPTAAPHPGHVTKNTFSAGSSSYKRPVMTSESQSPEETTTPSSIDLDEGSRQRCQEDCNSIEFGKAEVCDMFLRQRCSKSETASDFQGYHTLSPNWQFPASAASGDPGAPLRQGNNYCGVVREDGFFSRFAMLFATEKLLASKTAPARCDTEEGLASPQVSCQDRPRSMSESMLASSCGSDPLKGEICMSSGIRPATLSGRCVLPLEAVQEKEDPPSCKGDLLACLKTERSCPHEHSVSSDVYMRNETAFHRQTKSPGASEGPSSIASVAIGVPRASPLKVTASVPSSASVPGVGVSEGGTLISSTPSNMKPASARVRQQRQQSPSEKLGCPNRSSASYGLSSGLQRDSESVSTRLESSSTCSPPQGTSQELSYKYKSFSYEARRSISPNQPSRDILSDNALKYMPHSNGHVLLSAEDPKSSSEERDCATMTCPLSVKRMAAPSASNVSEGSKLVSASGVEGGGSRNPSAFQTQEVVRSCNTNKWQGILWQAEDNAWVVSWENPVSGLQHVRHFSMMDFGFEGARSAAIKFWRDIEHFLAGSQQQQQQKGPQEQHYLTCLSQDHHIRAVQSSDKMELGSFDYTANESHRKDRNVSTNNENKNGSAKNALDSCSKSTAKDGRADETTPAHTRSMTCNTEGLEAMSHLSGVSTCMGSNSPNSRSSRVFDCPTATVDRQRNTLTRGSSAFSHSDTLMVCGGASGIRGTTDHSAVVEGLANPTPDLHSGRLFLSSNYDPMCGVGGAVASSNASQMFHYPLPFFNSELSDGPARHPSMPQHSYYRPLTVEPPSGVPHSSNSTSLIASNTPSGGTTASCIPPPPFHGTTLSVLSSSGFAPKSLHDTFSLSLTPFSGVPAQAPGQSRSQFASAATPSPSCGLPVAFPSTGNHARTGDPHTLPSSLTSSTPSSSAPGSASSSSTSSSALPLSTAGSNSRSSAPCRSRGGATASSPRRARLTCPPGTAPPRSEVPGVYWYRNRNGWVAQWFENGKNKHKFFAASVFGVEGAKEKAIAYRLMKLEEKRMKAW